MKALLINGVLVEPGPRYVPPAPAPTPLKPRIFDHLDGAPSDEDRHFSRVARRMRSSAWWATIPNVTEPRCSVCGARQIWTRSGAVCVNGHGGAESIARWP